MVIFRVDGNEHIGTGHLMRCLTIATEIRSQNGQCNAVGISNSQFQVEQEDKEVCQQEDIIFVCADEKSAELPRTKDFRVIILQTDYQKMEEEFSVLEVELNKIFEEKQQKIQEQQFGKFSKKLPINEFTILVDSYYATPNYFIKLGTLGKIFFLDDMCQSCFAVDGIINYNAFADKNKYQVLYQNLQGKQPSFYLGTQYIPIRQEFVGTTKEESSRISEEVPVETYVENGKQVTDGIHSNMCREVQDILITTGGADEDNIAGKIIQKIYKEGLRYHIISGKYNPHFQELCNWAQGYPGVSIYHNVSNMAERMKQCQLAITAGGTTIYELSALGVPFICFSYAKNQEMLTKYIEKHKIAAYAGAYHLNSKETLCNIKQLTEALIYDTKLLQQCQMQEKTLVDGLGAKRLAKLLVKGWD